jgi:hypothetical protein
MPIPTRRSANAIPFQVLLAGVLFTFLLLPLLWAFQVVRSQGYSVVHDVISVRIGTALQTGRTQAFKAVPLGRDAQEKEQVADSSTANLFFRVLALSPRSKGRALLVRDGGREWKVGADGSVYGGEPGHRFVQAIFLQDSGNSNSYQQGKIHPDLVVVNWQDPAPWFRSTLRLDLPLEAGVLGFGLALVPWLLWTRRRNVFAPPPSWTTGGWKIPLGLTALVVAGHILSPRWLPAVATYLSLLAIWIGVGIRRLPAGPRHPAVPRWHLMAVALMVAAGFATKARLSDWGSPLVLHTDEYSIVDPAGTLSRGSGLDPEEFEHPNHPSIYLETAVSQAASEFLLGAPLGTTFDDHLALWHQVGRILSALWGALLAWAVWAGLRRYDPVAALLGCALATLFPAILQNSAYATPDVSQAFLVALFGWMLSRHVSDGDPRSLVLAALAAALATGEKFSGAVLLPILVLGACAAPGRKDWVVAALRASLAYFLLLFLTCPYLFLKAHLVLISVIGESRPTHPGADGLGLRGNLGFYAGAWRADASLLMTLAILPGAWRLLSKGRSALPLFTGLVFLASLSALPLHWNRWELPFLPMFIQCSAMGLAIPWTLARFGPRPGRLVWVAVGLVLVALPLSHQFLRCVQTFRTVRARDTRLDALAWSRREGVDTANALVGHYTGLAPIWKRGFDLYSAYGDPAYMRGRRWAMVSSAHYQRYFDDTARFSGEVGFWRDLLALPQVAGFDPVAPRIVLRGEPDWADLPLARSFLLQDLRAVRTGPRIGVFRLPSSCPDLPSRTAAL